MDAPQASPTSEVPANGEAPVVVRPNARRRNLNTIGKVKIVTPDELVAAVERLETQDRGWIHTLVLLGISVLIFFGAGLFKNPLLDVLLIVVVVFIHELGHYVGMLLFDYRNVKMFFIPFFGAAVSGKKTHVDGWKDAIVSLLGPLPGIAIGSALAYWHYYDPHPLLGQFAIWFIINNAFNLLPIYPLDGGQFLNEVLFVRSPLPETSFRFVAGSAGLAAGWYLDVWLFMGIGFFVLLTVGRTWRIGRIAKSLRQEGLQGAAVPLERLTPELAAAMLPHLRRSFTWARDASQLAGFARDIWDKLKARPPGFLATALLLGVYVASLGVLLTALILYVVMGSMEWQRARSAQYAAAERNDWNQAEEECRKALVIARQFPLGDPRLPETLYELGIVDAHLSNYEHAEKSLRAALELYELYPTEDDLALERTLIELAAVLQCRGHQHTEEIQMLVRRANDIRRKHDLPPHELGFASEQPDRGTP